VELGLACIRSGVLILPQYLSKIKSGGLDPSEERTSNTRWLGQTYDLDSMRCEFVILNNRRTIFDKLDRSCQCAVGCEIAGFVDKKRYKVDRVA
jgi:hypothetical protein